MGGFVNAAANQRDPSEYVGPNLSGVPEELFADSGAAVSVKVDERQTRPGQIAGEIRFGANDEPLQLIRVGGEEFLITRICVDG